MDQLRGICRGEGGQGRRSGQMRYRARWGVPRFHVQRWAQRCKSVQRSCSARGNSRPMAALRCMLL
eukprot:5851747-Lingulodinium_polyedra.AAC.1